MTRTMISLRTKNGTAMVDVDSILSIRPIFGFDLEEGEHRSEVSLSNGATFWISETPDQVVGRLVVDLR